MATCSFVFTVILGDNEKECDIKCCIDVFSVNQDEILDYVSKLGGTMVNSNTVRVLSDEAFTKLTRKLSSLTLPRKLSKKR